MIFIIRITYNFLTLIYYVNNFQKMYISFTFIEHEGKLFVEK